MLFRFLFALWSYTVFMLENWCTVTVVARGGPTVQAWTLQATSARRMRSTRRFPLATGSKLSAPSRRATDSASSLSLSCSLSGDIRSFAPAFSDSPHLLLFPPGDFAGI